MRTHKRFVFLTAAALTLAFHAGANAPESGTFEEGGPRLEIRQYRFSRHAGGYDRLVLEFERKDSDSSSRPSVGAQKSSTPREWSVQVDNAVLLGAIPESLINDSYTKKSRYLGPISVNMDNPSTGFSVRATIKSAGTRIQAMWLENPARLVIDAYGAGKSLAHRETSSVKSHQRPGLADLLCFPAVSKVGLTVIFQTQSHSEEELQNIRVNTDGTTPLEGTPSNDAIVCYAKSSRVVAALSFESKPKESLISRETPTYTEPATIPEPSFTAPAPATTPMASAPAVSNDMELDPGPLAMPAGLGQLPGMAGRAPAAEATKGMPAPAGSPLSLLPALNK